MRRCSLGVRGKLDAIFRVNVFFVALTVDIVAAASGAFVKLVPIVGAALGIAGRNASTR